MFLSELLWAISEEKRERNEKKVGKEVANTRKRESINCLVRIDIAWDVVFVLSCLNPRLCGFIRYCF